jgi:hypothetical protein
MPFTVKVELPAGYAAHPASKGETVTIVVSEFITSEQGQLFHDRLARLPSGIIAALPQKANILNSELTALLVIVSPDGSSTCYVNREITVTIEAVSKRAITAGEFISPDDCIDVLSVSLLDSEKKNIVIPDEASVIYYFAVGWTRALFYDYSPSHFQKRTFDIHSFLASCYRYLLFKERLDIDEEQFIGLMGKRLFPFIGLPASMVLRLISYIDNLWDIQELLPDIKAVVDQHLERAQHRWTTHRLTKPHCDLLLQAKERYIAEDFISACSILYPRIEGVLRTLIGETKKRIGQKTLIDAVKLPSQQTVSNLLPERFRLYLKAVVFPDFDQDLPTGLTRHTVAHGIADASEYTELNTLIGFLILDHILAIASLNQQLLVE